MITIKAQFLEQMYITIAVQTATLAYYLGSTAPRNSNYIKRSKTKTVLRVLIVSKFSLLRKRLSDAELLFSSECYSRLHFRATKRNCRNAALIFRTTIIIIIIIIKKQPDVENHIVVINSKVIKKYTTVYNIIWFVWDIRVH